MLVWQQNFGYDNNGYYNNEEKHFTRLNCIAVKEIIYVFHKQKTAAGYVRETGFH